MHHNSFVAIQYQRRFAVSYYLQAAHFTSYVAITPVSTPNILDSISTTAKQFTQQGASAW